MEEAAYNSVVKDAALSSSCGILQCWPFTQRVQDPNASSQNICVLSGSIRARNAWNERFGLRMLKSTVSHP